MHKKFRHILQKFRPQYVTAQLETFLHDETAGGKIILVAAVLSLIAVNTTFKGVFDQFWQTEFSLSLGRWQLSMDLRHWLNEGLMALFFLVVGLEIKRELVKGELREFRTAILPIGAAVGGMVIPAAIYLILNPSGIESQGWGIPIATDIAFALAVLSLLSRHVPVALKIFLLTLAIADDIGAITVIALFYAEIIHYGFLAVSVGIVVATFLLRRYLTNKLAAVVLIGIVLWLTTHLSGIHASIVGAVMGMLAPISRTRHVLSAPERVEKVVLPFSTYLVLPLFAFANAGFVFSSGSLNENTSVMLGIILGLCLGKVVGVVLFSWLLVKLKIASLPHGLEWHHIWGVGFIAGIGFTVSIFITELAFADNDALINAAKVSIFIASGLSALLGSVLLVQAKKHRDRRIAAQG